MNYISLHSERKSISTQKKNKIIRISTINFFFKRERNIKFLSKTNGISKKEKSLSIIEIYE